MAENFITPPLPTPLGEAPAFRALLGQLSQLAPLNRPVLVIGERGTGKELIASRLAYLSPRWDKPFLKLNCAALSEPLLDAELFGHEAGAFTGALRARASRFELADGGTLLLDEIASASLSVQEKLLRVIEYGSFERVGGNLTRQVDVRVIGATNADLPALAAAGRFRADLLDRLAFDVLNVPPLRERAEDIAVLAAHFAERMTSELGRAYFPGFTAAAMAGLRADPWPGNVRALRNTIERSVYRMARPDRPLDEVVFDPFATPWHAPPPPAETPDGGFHARTRAFEARILREAMQASRHHQKHAAERLGLTYAQMRHLLRTHGLLTPPAQL
jgi:psp operon transcriptional activator